LRSRFSRRKENTAKDFLISRFSLDCCGGARRIKQNKREKLVLLLLPLLKEEQGVDAGESIRKWVPIFVFGGHCVAIVVPWRLMTTTSFAKIAQKSER
jgi:hypothetical protein